MPLIYAFVARGTTVLAEYTSYHGNFSTVATECLQNLKNVESKFTITCDRHTFNFSKCDEFLFLVVADEAFGRQVPFAFLDRVSEEFMTKFADKGRTAAAHSMDRSFGPKLKQHLEYCMNHPDEISRVAAVQARLDEVRNIMVENIEKVLERGERIELLVDKTDDLRFQAEKFQKQGRQLRQKMWWNNLKVKIIAFLALLLLAVVIFLLVCFAGGKNCIKKGQQHTQQ